LYKKSEFVSGSDLTRATLFGTFERSTTNSVISISRQVFG